MQLFITWDPAGLCRTRIFKVWQKATGAEWMSAGDPTVGDKQAPWTEENFRRLTEEVELIERSSKDQLGAVRQIKLR